MVVARSNDICSLHEATLAVLERTGVRVESDEALALDAIHDVATDQSPGSLKFAAHPHTSDHLRADLWEPLVFSYDTFSTWQSKGSRSVTDSAEEIARSILEKHKPEPLDQGVEMEI